MNDIDIIKDKKELEKKATNLWLEGNTWGHIMETLDISDELLEELIGWRCDID